MARGTKVLVTISVEDPVLDVEREYEVECLVTPGSPGRGPSLDGPGEPPEDPEVVVVLVRDGIGALFPTDEAAFLAKHRERVEELALEKARDAEDDARAMRDEWAEDARREARG